MGFLAKTRNEPMLQAWARSGGEWRRWRLAAVSCNGEQWLQLHAMDARSL
jgi:hypothetical protein